MASSLQSAPPSSLFWDAVDAMAQMLKGTALESAFDAHSACCACGPIHQRKDPQKLDSIGPRAPMLSYGRGNEDAKGANVLTGAQIDAIRQAHVDEVVGINSLDSVGRTPLHHAILREDPVAVERLLRRGAPLQTDYAGHTVFHLIAETGSIEMLSRKRRRTQSHTTQLVGVKHAVTARSCSVLHLLSAITDVAFHQRLSARAQSRTLPIAAFVPLPSQSSCLGSTPTPPVSARSCIRRQGRASCLSITVQSMATQRFVKCS